MRILRQDYIIQVRSERYIVCGKGLGRGNYINTGQVGSKGCETLCRVARIVGELDRNGLCGSLRNGPVQFLDGSFCLSACVEANETHSFRQTGCKGNKIRSILKWRHLEF